MLEQAWSSSLLLAVRINIGKWAIWPGNLGAGIMFYGLRWPRYNGRVPPLLSNYLCWDSKVAISTEYPRWQHNCLIVWFKTTLLSPNKKPLQPSDVTACPLFTLSRTWLPSIRNYSHNNTSGNGNPFYRWEAPTREHWEMNWNHFSLFDL